MNRWISKLTAELRPREEIYRDADESRQFDIFYLTMMVSSCLVALLGLLMNSPAVIIGAMLISPLMGPILAGGLALSLADGRLGVSSIRNLAFSVAEVVLITAVATSISPLKDATPEIIARTNPNLMDLLVAFLSGIAGTMAFASNKGGLTILPGAAIATAIMPPLATVGYGISTRQWHLAGGAFMLFMTNFMAIVISADLVFLLIGFRPKKGLIAASPGVRFFLRYRVLISTFILLLFSIPLIRTLNIAVRQARALKVVRGVLRTKLAKPGLRLDQVNLAFQENKVLVEAVVETDIFITGEVVRSAEQTMQQALGRETSLHLHQLQLAREETASQPAASFLAGGLAPKTIELSAAEQMARLQSRAASELRAVLAGLPVKEIQVLAAGEAGGTLTLEFRARSEAPVAPETWQLAANALSSLLEAETRLKGEIEFPGPELQEVRFNPRSIYPNSADVRRVAAMERRWNPQSGYQIRFRVPPDADAALTARRMKVLQARFPQASMDKAVALPEGRPDIIGVRVVHNVDALGSSARH